MTAPAVSGQLEELMGDIMTHESAEAIEEWRDIPGYESLYQVSTHGRVRSLDSIITVAAGRVPSYTRRRRGMILNSWLRLGYPIVGLSKNGRVRAWCVHVLVAMAFLGHTPGGFLLVRHLDGNPENGHVSNLAVGTPSENMVDKRRHGTNHQVNKTHCKYGHPSNRRT